MCEGAKMCLNPNLEKSAIKLENRRESALILEKVLFRKTHLNAAYKRIAFNANIWLKGGCPLVTNTSPKREGHHKAEPLLVFLLH
jgi:hypothetical protein